ncbi:hypothetical protein N7523_008836 [Penicillium sp. IBT 18751x]|nr:hypothetical protein N7523_008836 [Penicillium sp. IBT 18751x]
MFAKSMLVAVLGASVVNAHMIMSNPVPYGKSTLNNSPLAADGSDFPCKLRDGTYDVTTENTIAIGESHALTFEGSATHGGGSCQISMTTDRAPTKDTEWKVIKSFEGGCPANVDGNLSGGASAADPYQFNFTIPEGIETGKYTLAWTWFNRIGNREMYMNCAPVTVTSALGQLPPMFVANVNGCTTKEGVDIRFPQPGDVVEYDGEPANLAAEGSAACTGTPTFGASGDTASGSSDSSSSSSSSSSGSGSGSSSSGSESSAAASSAPTETSSAAAAPTTSSAPAETSAPTVPETASTSTEAAPEATSASSNTISSGNSSTKSGTCSTEGQWNCIAGTSFQRCANGQWSVAQQMASGTVCTAGLSSDLTISASKMARHVSEMRFRKRNLHGHHA